MIRLLPLGFYWLLNRGKILSSVFQKIIKIILVAPKKSLGMNYIESRINKQKNYAVFIGILFLGMREFNIQLKDILKFSRKNEESLEKELRNKLLNANYKSLSVFEPNMDAKGNIERINIKKRKKILFMYPAYFVNSKVTLDLTENLLESAKNFGFDVNWIDTWKFSSKLQATLFTDDVISKIEFLNPDIIFIDGNLDCSKELSTKNLSKILGNLSDSKIFVLMADNYSVRYSKLAEIWLENVDKVLYYDKNSPVEMHNKHNQNLLLWLPPVPSTFFFPTDRKYDFFFSGSVSSHRHEWLNILIKKALKYEWRFEIKLHKKEIDKNTRPYSNYCENVRQSRFCVNLTNKGNGLHCLNGRSMQTIASNTLLIQEVGENHDPLSTFFEPYLHYIPFKSRKELEAILNLLKKEPDLLLKVTEAGYEFFKQNFTENKAWNRIIEIC